MKWREARGYQVTTRVEEKRRLNIRENDGSFWRASTTFICKQISPSRDYIAISVRPGKRVGGRGEEGGDAKHRLCEVVVLVACPPLGSTVKGFCMSLGLTPGNWARPNGLPLGL